MSSSIGGSSALHLALLNQLLQRVGVNDQDSVDNSSTADASQADGNGSSFNSQADALFNSLDSDGDGKLSKSEFRTGFQKLSQDMRSVLLDQQSISGGDATDSSAESTDSSSTTPASATPSAFSSFDADGDGTVSEGEFNAGAARLLDSLLQSAGSSTAAAATSPTTDTSDSAAATTSSPTATATDGAAISSDEMDKLLNNLRNSQPGDVANVPAMMRLRQSTSLHAAVTDLLQAIQPQQTSTTSATGATTTSTAATGATAQS